MVCSGGVRLLDDLTTEYQNFFKKIFLVNFLKGLRINVNANTSIKMPQVKRVIIYVPENWCGYWTMLYVDFRNQINIPISRDHILNNHVTQMLTKINASFGQEWQIYQCCKCWQSKCSPRHINTDYPFFFFKFCFNTSDCLPLWQTWGMTFFRVYLKPNYLALCGVL